MFLLVISVNHTNTIFKVSLLGILLTGKNTASRVCNIRSTPFLYVPTSTKDIANMDVEAVVNCIKTLELLKCVWTIKKGCISYGTHLRSSNVFIQLTHSMLPLSLLILGCYTCSIYRTSINTDIDGTSIATYKEYMSRDNGNIECTSTPPLVNLSGVDVSATSNLNITGHNCNLECHNEYPIESDIKMASEGPRCVAEDLYSHQYGHQETIKTISNMVTVTKNIIIPLINGTGTIFPVMIIFCIRDSLREYKSNYVILSNMKLVFYN